MRAFLAVDVVLVLAFVAVLLMTRTGGADDAPEAAPQVSTSEATTPGPEATSAGATAEDQSGDEPTSDEPSEDDDGVLDAPALFASPSGNIVCSISSDAASCSIAQLADGALVEDDECAGTVGHVVRVSSEGDTERPCVTGAPPGAAPEATPVLEYEDSTSTLGFTCTSSRSGIICRHDGTGHGFSIARAGSSLF